MRSYQELGVLYYTIYNPEHSQRDGHSALEVYRLIQGKYVLQQGEPFWMPELGLGIGRGIGNYTGISREWLYWYDRSGNRYPTPQERGDRQQQRADRQQQRADRQQQRAEQEKQRANLQQQRADHQQQRAEQEKQRANLQQQRAEQAELELEKKEAIQQQAISQLLKLGLSVEQIASALSLSVEFVRKAISNNKQ